MHTTAADELVRACAGEAGASLETASITGENGSSEENLESTEGNWKNYNAGVLQTLSGVESADSIRAPRIPDCFLDRPHIVQIAKEIHGTHTPDGGRPFERPDQEPPDWASCRAWNFPSRIRPRLSAHSADPKNHSRSGGDGGRWPEVLVQSVVASRQVECEVSVSCWRRRAWARAGSSRCPPRVFGRWPAFQLDGLEAVLPQLHAHPGFHSRADSHLRCGRGGPARAGWIRYEPTKPSAWLGRERSTLYWSTWKPGAKKPARRRRMILNCIPTSSTEGRTGLHSRNNRDRMKYAELYRCLGLPITQRPHTWNRWSSKLTTG